MLLISTSVVILFFIFRSIRSSFIFSLILSGSVGTPYLIFPDIDTDSVMNMADKVDGDDANGNEEVKLGFPQLNSTSSTQGPSAIGMWTVISFEENCFYSALRHSRLLHQILLLFSSVPSSF